MLVRLIAGMLSVVTMLGASTVSAQNFPTKPIRIYTGSAGGNNDTASRLIAGGIAGPLGQPVIVENRGGVVSPETVAKAVPDGYSLLVIGDSVWLGPLLYGQPDALQNFAPISIMASSPNILVVHSSLPVKSVKELIALAKSRPGALNFSTSETGGIDHIAPELFKSMAGIKMERISYKGAASAATALASGEVQLMIGGVTVTAPYLKSGKMKALAVTTAQPSAAVPGLPTIAASGLPGFELAVATALYAPAKTPAVIINQLNREVVRFLRTKEVQEKYLSLGGEVIASSPEEHAAILKSRFVVFGKVIREAGIKGD